MILEQEISAYLHRQMFTAAISFVPHYLPAVSDAFFETDQQQVVSVAALHANQSSCGWDHLHPEYAQHLMSFKSLDAHVCAALILFVSSPHKPAVDL